MNKLLFVYGSLKSDSKTSLLNTFPKAIFIQNYQLREHILYKQPFRNVSVMVKTNDKLDYVIGEIYLVNDEILKQLDIREGTKWNWYRRTEIGEMSTYIWNHTTIFFKRIGNKWINNPQQ